jgi:hypothetical protein
MSNLLKKIISGLAVLFLFTHFILIALYCTSKSNFLVQKVSNIYIHPVFHQNWNLFVPAPDIHKKIFVRYKTNDSWTNWEDIMQKKCNQLRTNPFVGHDLFLLMFSNSVSHPNNALTKHSYLYNQIPKKDFGLFVINFEINKFLKNEYNLKNTTCYEVIVFYGTPNLSNALYLKNQSIH